jgi:hypothetical protein
MKNKVIKSDWLIRAQAKEAVIPEYFEVFTSRVELVCGACKKPFKRPLVLNLNDPVFVCPSCKTRNWVPITYDLKT